MVDLLLREDGVGGYSNMAAALGAAGTNDRILIQDTWSSADTSQPNVDVNFGAFTITAEGASRHTGRYEAAGSSYRLVTTPGSRNAIFEVSGGTPVFDGFVLRLANTGAATSKECVRNKSNTAEITVQNMIVEAERVQTNEDGLYSALTACTYYVENTVISGFSRGGINFQHYTGQGYPTFIDVVASTIQGCGHEVKSGGFVISDVQGGSGQINIFSSCLSGNQYNADTYDVNYGYGVAPLQYLGMLIRDTAWQSLNEPGWGNNPSNTWPCVFAEALGPTNPIIIESLANRDFRLRGTVGCVALDRHSTATEPTSGLNMPATDFIGNSRPQNTLYDRGPHEYTVSGPVTPGDLSPGAQLATGV